MTKEKLKSTSSAVVSRGYKWTSKTLWGYGVGHIENDLCATLWFSYLLVFLEQVTKMDPGKAGILMVIGQLTDGIATPIVGLGLDKFGLCGTKYGRRKSWHMLGTLMVSISFAFIYTPPFGHDPSDSSSTWSQTEMVLYYTPFIMLFQVAWASVQVSHLSLIPCLTSKDSARIQLNSIRYAFTVLSNLAVFIACNYLLQRNMDKSTESVALSNFTTTAPIKVEEMNLTMQDGECTMQDGKTVDWSDRYTFMYLAMGSIVAGVVFQSLFHVFVEEDNLNCCEEDHDVTVSVGLLSHQNRSRSGTLTISSPQPGPQKSQLIVDKWTDWFKESAFYNVAALYCLTRLIVNITATYIPYYLQTSLCLEKEYIARIPLIQYLTGFLTSFLMKPLPKYLGKNGTYFLGAFVTIVAAIWATILKGDNVAGIYGLAVLYGIGTTTVLVQSLAITADLIGENVSSAAFVYGAMSLTDKIACGCVIMLLQELKIGCGDSNTCGLFYCQVMGYGIGAISVFAIIANLSHWRLSRQN